MPQSRSQQKSDDILSERYRRQYERNRRAHLRHSSHELAEKRRGRARRKRASKYFTLILLAFVISLAFAALATFYDRTQAPPRVPAGENLSGLLSP